MPHFEDHDSTYLQGVTVATPARAGTSKNSKDSSDSTSVATVVMLDTVGTRDPSN
jgi:hypothetical protein